MLDQRFQPPRVKPDDYLVISHDDWAPKERRLGNHQVQQLIVAHLAARQTQITVGTAARGQHITRPEPGAGQERGQLVPCETVLEEVARPVADPTLLEELPSTTAAGSRRVNVDIHGALLPSAKPGGL